MAKAIVKCLYCGKQFDRNDPSIQWVKPTERRYAHKQCAAAHEKNMTQEERDAASLYKYLKQLFGNDYEFMKIKQQVNQYIKEYQYTYSGIEKSMKYFYEIKGNSISRANGGIGIVPYIYKEAYQYYYRLHLAQQINKGVQNYTPQVQHITIMSPRTTTRQPRLFDLDWEEEVEEK